jgi:DNA-binding beta-propeller fold protein YncE
VGAYPRAIAITPDGSRALIANYSDNTVTALAVGADGGLTVTGTALVVLAPSAIAITSDGSRALIANYDDNTVTALAVGAGGLSSPLCSTVKRDTSQTAE